MFVFQCESCGETWKFETEDVIIMEPYPHYICPNCGAWIPAF